MQFDVRITGAKAIVIKSDSGSYQSIKEVQAYFMERSKTQTFANIYLGSIKGPIVSDIDELKDEKHYQNLVKEHEQKVAVKQAFYKNPWMLFVLINILVVSFVFYVGYQYLEPLNWHHWMEGHFPNIFNAWNQHPNAITYEITYAWLFLIGLVMLPYFIYLYNNDDPEMVKEVVHDKYRLLAVIVSVLVCFWCISLMLDTPSFGKLAYFSYQTQILGLLAQFILILSCYSFLVLLVACIFYWFQLLLRRVSK